MGDGGEWLGGRFRRFSTELANARIAEDVRSIATRFLEQTERVIGAAEAAHQEYLDESVKAAGLRYSDEPARPGDSRDLDETELFRAVNLALDSLREVIRRANNVTVLEWVRASAASIPNSMLHPDEGWDWLTARRAAAGFPQISDQANLLLDTYSLEDERERILDDARRSAAEAQVAADKARASAGVTGSSSLATHFSTYARQERKAAEIFRGLTIAGVVGAIAAAVLVGPIEAGDWAQLTRRIATVAAVGTLLAYFARQAGQHRRVYNWAKSLEVQLKSFPAFVEPVAEAERVEIYRAFARRVLSGPPEKGVEGTDDSVGAAQLLDVVTALAKRT